MEIIDITEGDNLKQALKIYDDSFPTWEKEPQKTIIDRLNDGSYFMRGVLKGKEVVGFYIIVVRDEFSLLSYVAIKEEHRGKGIGSKLVLDSILEFQKSKQDYFFIEGEDRQARLYERLGFSRIKIEYLIPEFDSPNVFPMNLLVYSDYRAIEGILSNCSLSMVLIFSPDKLLRGDRAFLAQLPR